MNSNFIVQNPNYLERIKKSFKYQGLITHLGATLLSVEPGIVAIELPISQKVSQQHGFVHAGALATIMDTACGYAALSLMPEKSEVLAVEFKINFLSPVRGEKAVTFGKVMKAGRTLTICQGEIFSVDEKDVQKLCAVMQATMIRRTKGSSETN